MLFSTFMRNFAVVKLKNGRGGENEKPDKSGNGFFGLSETPARLKIDF